MTNRKKLRLDTLQVETFATAEAVTGPRGTVRANAVDLSAGCLNEPIPDTDRCQMSIDISCLETWDMCPSEYRTACEPWLTDPLKCAVEYPTDPLPA